MRSCASLATQSAKCDGKTHFQVRRAPNPPDHLSKEQGSQIRQIWRILRQNCSDDSTEVTEGVTLTSEIFSNKQGATSTPGIFGNKHSFVPTFFATNAIYINFKRCKP